MYFVFPKSSNSRSLRFTGLKISSTKSKIINIYLYDITSNIWKDFAFIFLLFKLRFRHCWSTSLTKTQLGQRQTDWDSARPSCCWLGSLKRDCGMTGLWSFFFPKEMKDHSQMSAGKKTRPETLIPWKQGLLNDGILIVVYDNPHLTAQYNRLNTLNNKAFFIAKMSCFIVLFRRYEEAELAVSLFLRAEGSFSKTQAKHCIRKNHYRVKVIHITYICIMYLEPNWHLFLKVKTFSNQNKGNLGSRNT